MGSKLNYDDITIVPEVVTDIETRKQCYPFDENGYLPIFASCMSSVINDQNYKAFNSNKIKVVIPRNLPLTHRIVLAKLHSTPYCFVAFSLNEVIEMFLHNHSDEIGIEWKFSYICIDLANGHMKKLLDTVKAIKQKCPQITIMTGNIANPKTYKLYDEAGVDYVRLSIGSGACCTTASNTGVHYPVFSLLKETYDIKKSINGKCKIIADGGIKDYRDIQKALIYADDVMIGSLFNKAIESAGKTTYGASYFIIKGHKVLRPIKTLFQYGRTVRPGRYWKEEKFNKLVDDIKKGKIVLWKECYGMSTKLAQQEINCASGSTCNNTTKLKTAEGLVKRQKVEFSIKGWVENEIDYLRSAMSYTNSRTLEEYKESQYVRITEIRYNR